MLRILFKGFTKDGTNAFDQHCDINIEFNPFVYNIKINNEQVREFLYSEYLDVENAKDLVKHSVKKAFDAIKNRIKNA